MYDTSNPFFSCHRWSNRSTKQKEWKKNILSFVIFLSFACIWFQFWVFNKWVLVGNWIAMSLRFLSRNSPFSSNADVDLTYKNWAFTALTVMMMMMLHNITEYLFNCWKNSEKLSLIIIATTQLKRWVEDGKWNLISMRLV